MRGLRVIREFDPWGSPLCTCPHKFTLNPYTGCAHGCLYCYARSYIRDFDRPRPKKGLIKNVVHDLGRLPKGALVSMSESSDPYTPPEASLGLTRRVFKLTLKAGFKLLVVTKSDLVLRDLDVVKGGRVAVAITITTARDDLARVIEPSAPPPSRRLLAVREVSRAGVPVTVRIDPIIPGVNDDEWELRDLVGRVADAGALQVTSSTFKARWDSLKRLSTALPDLSSFFRNLYVGAGTRVGGYYYLPRQLRFRYMAFMKGLVEGYGMAFATCREGFPQLHTPGTECDGSGYIL